VTPRKILVTGGAGYIGSHTVRLLLKQGHDVTVVDNLSKGYRHNVPAERLRELDLSDTGALTSLLREKQCDAVIHFAAFIAVGESMREPARYFTNNVAGSLSLLDAMVQAGVKHIVFSSTAAVYGNPHTSPILETFPIQAVNPYGESKVMVETLLGWFDQIHQLTSVCLRYFNASGADPEAALGEEHEPETHLIPLVIRAAQTGRPVTIFGDDYATPDGTCIRDYIHVNDLAQAQSIWDASRGTVDQAQRTYAIDEVRYREGISTQTDLTQSRLLLEQARANRAQAARNLAVAKVRLALLKDLPLQSGGTTGAAAVQGAGAAIQQQQNSQQAQQQQFRSTNGTQSAPGAGAPTGSIQP